MTAIKRTISLSNELNDFLEVNSELSLSKVTQQALRNIIENRKDLDGKIRILQNKIVVMQNKIFELDEKNALLEKEKTE